MKRLFTLTLLTIISFSFVNISAEEVSQRQAFEIISQQFDEQNVDYYSITAKDSVNSDKWMFFVDALPQALWEHTCYVVSYPKNTSTSGTAIDKIKYSFPPEEYEYTPYQLNVLMETDFNSDFIIAPLESRGTYRKDAKRTFALIIGGRTSVIDQPDRFDSDCRFFFQTLTKSYNIPKDNIYTLLNQPKEYDKNSQTYVLKDLDGDNLSDVTDESTQYNIQKYLANLENKIKTNDNLVIFISSHGSAPNAQGSSLYISPVNLYADKFIQWIQPFINNKVNITVILGACYSKHFAEKLNQKGCVALAASDEVAIRSNLSFFLRYITSAINGRDYNNGKKTDADYDNDSYISISEAFKFANTKISGKEYVYHEDGRKKSVYMHPYIQSTPEELADIIAINRVPSQLNIKQASTDKLLADGIYWNSPDIWLRNNFDKKEEHQQIELKGVSNRAWVNVRVTNNGDVKFVSGKTLRLYWAQATSILDSNLCKNVTIYDNEPFGGHIADLKISDISANNSKVFSVRMDIPNELTLSSTHPEYHQFTIFAELVDDNDNNATSFNIGRNSGTAQSTYTIIEQTDTVRATAMFFYNPLNEQKSYKLKFHWRDEESKNLFKYANVTVDMSPTVYRAWERGRNCTRAIASSNYSPYATEMTEDFSEYSKIIMNPHSIGRISFIFDFYDAMSSIRNYTFDIVQTDDNDNIVGGQTITLTPPHKNIDNKIPVDSLIWDGGIGTINPDPEYPFLPTWYNSKRQKVATGRTLRLNPENCNDTYRIVAITPEGELMSNEVTVSVEFGIKYISYDENFYNGINITMHDTPVSGYNLTLTSIATGKVIYSKELSTDEREINIPTYDLQSGMYVLTCTLNGEVIDTYKFSKQ